ncbi:MAG: hypothetical protein HYR64_06050 [Fimbriimonas ginsengisoli]|uniref:ABM domain-containing protein n=1 Tax=Fimbriimonas ginsengisoli TaxID=1005039 RepID=A0A931LSI5_FIMGI|nr:hypothetical protein [Fimbriimonas ginsengisoli]
MITVISELDSVTSKQYDEVCRLANFSESNVPDGLVFHCASPTDRGLVIVDVWENEDKFGKFRERLNPAISQAGMTHKEPKIYRTYKTIQGKVLATR